MISVSPGNTSISRFRPPEVSRYGLEVILVFAGPMRLSWVRSEATNHDHHPPDHTLATLIPSCHGRRINIENLLTYVRSLLTK